jgi:hypothetical protein
MANQENFIEQINTETKRFSISRVAEIPQDQILFAVQPADFGFYENDNIEIHFYSKFTEELVYSRRVSISDGILAIKTILYLDEKYRNYITFDFNKFIELYPSSIGPGEYRIVLNVFSDEIGSYENRNLIVDAISDSRTEVNLRFKNPPTEKDIENLNYFISPAISKPYVDGILQNIFLTGAETSDETVGLTIDRIIRELNQIGETLDLARTDNIGKIEDIKVFVNNLMETVYNKMVIELISYPRYRISEQDVKLIIERIFYEEFNKVKDSFRADIILT